MSSTSDFKSQSEGGAGGGEGGCGGEDRGVEESPRPEMCNTRSTTGTVCLGSFHQANFPDKVGVEHRRRSLKGERRAGRCNPGSLTLIDRKEWKEIFQLKANVTAKGPACNIQRHLIKNNKGVCMNVFGWK